MNSTSQRAQSLRESRLLAFAPGPEFRESEHPGPTAKAEASDRGTEQESAHRAAKGRRERQERAEKDEQKVESPDTKLQEGLRKDEIEGWLRAEKIPNGLQVSVKLKSDGREDVTVWTDYGWGGRAILRHNSVPTKLADGTTSDPKAEILDYARAMARKTGLTDPSRDADHPKLKQVRQWLDEAGVPPALQMGYLDSTPTSPERIAFKTPDGINKVSIENTTLRNSSRLPEGSRSKAGCS